MKHTHHPDSSRAILETADQRDCDLIVMGWKGYTSTAKKVLGEVVDTVVDHARADVMLVKQTSREPLRRLLTTHHVRADAIESEERIEVDEPPMSPEDQAFVAQYIACERELGLKREITNVNGSGIGLGHPVGATGARIMVTLIHTLQQHGKSLGLATLCGGGGVSMACAVEMM